MRFCSLIQQQPFVSSEPSTKGALRYAEKIREKQEQFRVLTGNKRAVVVTLKAAGWWRQMFQPVAFFFWLQPPAKGG
jgi:hypothetical protein